MKIGNTINIINNSSKTFLKEKNEEIINQNKKKTIDELINDDNQISKVKKTMDTIFTMINDGKELNIEEIQNNNNNDISNSNKNVLFIKDESKSFLKKEEEKKKERKKKTINNNNLNEEKKSRTKKGILNKIDENYKYLYKLYRL